MASRSNTKDILFRFLGDAKDLSSATRKARGDLGSTEKSAGKASGALTGMKGAAIGLAGALSVREFGQFAWDAALMAEAAENAGQSAERVLGPALEGLHDRLDGTRQQLGFNILEFDSLVAKLGLLTEGYGLADEEQAAFIENMVRRGGDLAVFNGRTGDTAEAIDAMTAAIRGEFDPLEQWGVKLSQAQIKEKVLELRADDANDALTDQQLEIEAITLLIEEKAGPAIGSLAENQEDLAVQTNEAKSRLEDLKIEIGEKLIPVITDGADSIAEILDQFQKVTDSGTPLIERLQGIWLWVSKVALAASGVQGIFEGIAGAFQAVKDKFAGFTLPDFSGITNPFDDFTLPGQSSGPPPRASGRVPSRHSGGRVPGPTGQETLIRATGGEMVTNPLLGGGSGQPITINVTAGVGDPQAIAETIVDALRVYNETNGALPVTVAAAEG